MNFRVLGRTLTSSSSTRPVIEELAKVRYMAKVPSRAPLFASFIKSALLLDFGSMSSTYSDNASYSFLGPSLESWVSHLPFIDDSFAPR